MDEKIKTRTLRFPTKTLIWTGHCSIGQSCYSMTSKRNIDLFLKSSRAWSFFTRTTRVCIRWINQSNRSISVRLLFIFCSHVFISRSHENPCSLRWVSFVCLCLSSVEWTPLWGNISGSLFLEGSFFGIRDFPYLKLSIRDCPYLKSGIWDWTNARKVECQKWPSALRECAKFWVGITGLKNAIGDPLSCLKPLFDRHHWFSGVSRVVKFLACPLLLGFSNPPKMIWLPIFNGFLPLKRSHRISGSLFSGWNFRKGKFWSLWFSDH